MNNIKYLYYKIINRIRHLFGLHIHIYCIDAAIWSKSNSKIGRIKCYHSKCNKYCNINKTWKEFING